MTTVLIHPFSSLLSAYGMGLADIRATRQQAIEEPLGDDVVRTIREVGGRLDEQAIGELEQQGVSADSVSVQGHAHLRYAGTDTTLPVLAYSIVPRIKDEVMTARGRPRPDGGLTVRSDELVARTLDGSRITAAMYLSEPDVARMTKDFEEAHRARFGFIDKPRRSWSRRCRGSGISDAEAQPGGRAAGPRRGA